MKEKAKQFFKYNAVVFVYLFFMLFCELVSISFIGCIPFLTSPLYSLTLLLLVVSILFLVRNTITKAVLSCVLFAVQIVMNVGFVYLYDSNGTFFEWAMLNQRNDAFGTIESLSLRWGLVALLGVCYAIFIVSIILIHKFLYNNKKTIYKTEKLPRVIFASVLTIASLATLLTPTINAMTNINQSYVNRYLYGSGENRYQQMGITANAIYEFFNGTIADAAMKIDDKGIEEFLYNEGDPYLQTSEYNGISKNNNLIYILVESFEWYSFLDCCTEEQSKVLYPNLNKFLNNSVYANNFYSREKTDTAEMLSLLGSNPTNKYTNYDFPTNTFNWSLPNLFRQSVEENGNTIKHIKSFHQNTGDFYNRNTLHESLGFDELVDIEDMKAYGVENYWDEDSFKGERTLDSITVEKMQDEMFPIIDAGEQYMTFWLSFVMHGYYVERETFKDAGYYDKLDSVGAYPEGNTKDNYLRTYAAAVMDFDKAVGIMMDKLEQNGDLDNTTIVLFSDHNTYYNNLSYHAKGIEERFNSELYRVPFMIYDQEFVSEFEKNEGTREITKFTTTSDMLPTVLDLFGIQGYKNLYYGTSMFIDGVESVIFSRAYGIFVTNKLICYSAKKLEYKCEGFTKEDLKDFEERAKILLRKQEYLDKIYYNDYFKTHDYQKLGA